MVHHFLRLTWSALTAVCILMFSVAGPAFSIDLQYIPVLPPIITNPSLSQIDLFGEGIGAPIFILSLNNAGDTGTYTSLRIRYTATLEFSDNGTQRRQLLYEGLTGEFTVSANEVIKISSTEFLKGNNSSVRTSLKYMEYELDDPVLKDRLISSALAPDGILTFALELYPPFDQDREDNSFSHRIMNTTSIDPVAPGNELGQPPAELYSQRPQFTWVSQLYPGIYNGDDVFELRIYEARPGVSSSEALARTPFFTRRINAYNFQYPADAHQLVPGYTYYWQVTGFLRGAFTSELRSDVYAFTMVPLIDSTAVFNPRRIDEVLEILRPLIGDAMVEQFADYISGEIRIDNDPVSKAKLSEIVRRIITGEFTAGEPSVR